MFYTPIIVVIYSLITAYSVIETERRKSMDMQKEYSCLEKNCKIFTKVIDIEGDYQESLPAYLDDIYRVVKCTSNSYVTSADISFNEVKIYGKCAIQITYYNEKSRLCFADFEEDFSKVFTLDNLTESSFVRAVICDKYTNFRVINQRRIDVRTMSVLNISVYDRVKFPTVKSFDSAKLKTRSVATSDVAASYIDKIDFDEEVTLPSDAAAIGRIISSSTYPTVTDVKVIKDKMLIKAELKTTILYTADDDDGGIEKASYSFSLSKIVDRSGLEDDDTVIADVALGSVFFKIKGTAGEKVSVINIFGDIALGLTVIRENTAELVTDGYAAGRESTGEYTEFTASTDGRFVTERKLVDVPLMLNGEITEIKELGLKLKSPNYKKGAIHTTVDAVAIVSNDGGLSSVSASADVDIPAEKYDDAIVSLCIDDYDYTLAADGRIDMRLNLEINAYYFNVSTIPVLADITIGDEIKNNHALTVYFAKENEKVWDIAKSFLSDESKIIQDNALKSDTLDSSKVLIIPRA